MNESSQSSRSPRFQFSLAGLLGVVCVVAAFLGGWSVGGIRSRYAEELARRNAELARVQELMARDQAEQALQAMKALEQAKTTLTDGSDSAVAHDPGTMSQQIQDVLTAQAEAWNHGDIDRFMEHYWRSDELSFSAGGSTTRGWEATLARYRAKYPTRERMGRLTFDELHVSPLGGDAALVLGRWKLDREGDSPQGNFSLVLRKLEGRWQIIHDHTSGLDMP